METFSCFCLLFFLNKFMVFLTIAKNRFGLYRQSRSFDGLLWEFQTYSKVQCSARWVKWSEDSFLHKKNLILSHHSSEKMSCSQFQCGLVWFNSAISDFSIGIWISLTKRMGVKLRSESVSRCLASSCRGIQFDNGHCKIFFETSDVPQSEITKYMNTSLRSNGKTKILQNCRLYNGVL